jgi:MFS family permease
MARSEPAAGQRWVLLAASLTAWAVGATAVFQLALVLPILRAETGISLAAASALVGIANGGLTLGLLGWGILADRFGERGTMSCGLTLCALLLCAAAVSRTVPVLFVVFGLVGVAAGSVYAPSGRAVVRGFPVRQRAFALGLTQTSTPLASALAAAIVPGLAASHGLATVWLSMAALCLLAAVFVAMFGRQPTATDSSTMDSSGDASATLRRMYFACVLLVLPQSALLTFSVSYLVDEWGWSPAEAGRLLAAALLITVITRPVVGHLSDRLGHRLTLMRVLAFGNAGVLVLMVTAAVSGSWLGPLAVLTAVTSTVTGYGLASAVVAGFAAQARLGRALGVQHTLQSLVTTVGPIALSGVIGLAGYTAAFAAVALAPLAGAVVLPVAAERASHR